MNLDTQNLPPEVAAYIPVTGARETAAGTEEATAEQEKQLLVKTAGEDAVPE